MRSQIIDILEHEFEQAMREAFPEEHPELDQFDTTTDIGFFTQIQRRMRTRMDRQYAGIAIGKRLCEIKARTPHGKWLSALKESGFYGTPRLAQMYMRHYKASLRDEAKDTMWEDNTALKGKRYNMKVKTPD